MQTPDYDNKSVPRVRHWAPGEDLASHLIKVEFDAADSADESGTKINVGQVCVEVRMSERVANALSWIKIWIPAQ